MESSVNLQELGFTDLLDIYQTRSEELGQAPDDSFKTKEALVDAINALASAPPAGGNGADRKDNSKYSSTGRRGPNQGVGAFAKEHIAAGKTNQEVLDLIAETYPSARTTMPCIAYYRNSLKKGGTSARGGSSSDPAALRKQAQDLLEKADRLERAQAEAMTKESIEARVREEIEARVRQEVEARYAEMLAGGQQSPPDAAVGQQAAAF